MGDATPPHKSWAQQKIQDHAERAAKRYKAKGIDIEAVKNFIDEIAERPGNDSPDALWPSILASAFTAANHGPLVPLIYQRAIRLFPPSNSPSSSPSPITLTPTSSTCSPIPNDSSFSPSNIPTTPSNIPTTPTESSPTPYQQILRLIKESLLKTSLLVGLPKTLNSAYSLLAFVRGENSDRFVVRRIEGFLEGFDKGGESQEKREKGGLWNGVRENGCKDEVEEDDLETRGIKYFSAIYENDTESLLEPLRSEFHDLYILLMPITYGLYFSNTTLLSAKQTSIITLAALYPQNVPVQMQWHSRGFLRNGGTKEELEEVLEVLGGVCRVLNVGVELDGVEGLVD